MLTEKTLSLEKREWKPAHNTGIHPHFLIRLVFEISQVSTLIRICSKCNFVSTKRMRPDAPVYITSAKLNIFL